MSTSFPSFLSTRPLLLITVGQLKQFLTEEKFSKKLAFSYLLLLPKKLPKVGFLLVFSSFKTFDPVKQVDPE